MPLSPLNPNADKTSQAVARPWQHGLDGKPPNLRKEILLKETTFAHNIWGGQALQRALAAQRKNGKSKSGNWWCR